MGKFLKLCVGLSVGKLDWFCVELLRNSQQSIGRPKVCLEVKSLVVLMSARWLHCCLLGLLITVSGLAKVAIFTTNVDAENQTLINHKCVCGALNRHFCQTRVMPSAYSHSITILFISFISLFVSVNATMIF